MEAWVALAQKEAVMNWNLGIGDGELVILVRRVLVFVVMVYLDESDFDFNNQKISLIQYTVYFPQECVVEMYWGNMITYC